MSEKLTIAQALRRIKKLKGQIAEHEQRAKAGVSYDVNKVPAFSYGDSVNAMFALQDEVVALEARVAVANAKKSVQDGTNKVSLAQAVRTLQELKGRIAFLKGLHLRNEVVQTRTNDWDDVEMKHINRLVETTFKSDLSEKERDQQVRALQDRFDVLNNAVEEANHTVSV